VNKKSPLYILARDIKYKKIKIHVQIYHSAGMSAYRPSYRKMSFAVTVERWLNLHETEMRFKTQKPLQA